MGITMERAGGVDVYVTAGDTLDAIAAELGTSKDDLFAQNRDLTPDGKIIAGAERVDGLPRWGTVLHLNGDYHAAESLAVEAPTDKAANAPEHTTVAEFALAHGIPLGQFVSANMPTLVGIARDGADGINLSDGVDVEHSFKGMTGREKIDALGSLELLAGTVLTVPSRIAPAVKAPQKVAEAEVAPTTSEDTPEDTHVTSEEQPVGKPVALQKSSDDPAPPAAETDAGTAPDEAPSMPTDVPAGSTTFSRSAAAAGYGHIKNWDRVLAEVPNMATWKPQIRDQFTIDFNKTVKDAKDDDSAVAGVHHLAEIYLDALSRSPSSSVNTTK